MIGNQICEIAKESGDPEEYDLIVDKKGEGLRTEYIVSLGKSSDLTDEEQKKIGVDKPYLISKRFKK